MTHCTDSHADLTGKRGPPTTTCVLAQNHSKRQTDKCGPTKHVYLLRSTTTLHNIVCICLSIVKCQACSVF